MPEGGMCRNCDFGGLYFVHCDSSRVFSSYEVTFGIIYFEELLAKKPADL